MHQALLALIDAADADLSNHARVDRRHLPADLDQRARTVPAQASHRHAVQIAAGRQHVGVEIRVRIEPQDPQRLAPLAAVARDRTDRSHGQAVIAPEQHRKPCRLQLGMHGRVHQLVPCHHLAQVPVTLLRGRIRIARTVEIALIAHFESLRLERGLKPGDSQRLGAHRGAARAGADVRGRSDQSYCTAPWR